MPICSSWKFFFVISVPFLLMWIPFVFNSGVNRVTGLPSVKGNCLYIIALMVAGWTTNAIPSVPVSLIAVCMVPLLGIQKASVVATNFLTEQGMLVIGQMMVGCAIVVSEFHKRLAMCIMSYSGNCYLRIFTSVFFLTLGFSMLISSAATALLMCATVVVCVEECLGYCDNDREPNEAFENLKKRKASKMVRPGDSQIVQIRTESKKSKPVIPVAEGDGLGLTEGVHNDPASDEEGANDAADLEDDLEYQAALGATGPVGTKKSSATLNLLGRDVLSRKLKKRFFIAIYVAANIGGIALPYTSATPNLIYEYAYTELRPVRGGPSPLRFTRNGEPVYLTVLRYLVFVLPVIIILAPFAWLYLGFLFTKICCFIPGQKKTLFGKRTQSEMDQLSEDRKTYKEKLEKLGKMNVHERLVIAALVALVLLWFFRDTRIGSTNVPRDSGLGWARLIPFDRTNGFVRVGDSAVTLLIVICMFAIPRAYSLAPDPTAKQGLKPSPLLGWKFLESNVPWNVAITMGGQHVISAAVVAAGLDEDAAFALYEKVPGVLVPLVYGIQSTLAGELWGGFATVNLMTPLYAMFSTIGTEYNMYAFVAFSSSIISSLCFMFPVATPTNLLVFWTASGDLTIPDMIKYGALLDLVACIVVVIVHYVLGFGLFDNDIPPSS